MNKKKMREFAKDILMRSIATVYYKLEKENLSEEEEKQITLYINQYGKTMAKAIGRRYYTMQF